MRINIRAFSFRSLQSNKIAMARWQQQQQHSETCFALCNNNNSMWRVLFEATNSRLGSARLSPHRHARAISASHWHLPFPVTVLVVVNVVVVVSAAVVGHSSYLCMGTSNKNFLDCWTINLQWATRRCQRAVKKHKKKKAVTHTQPDDHSRPG